MKIVKLIFCILFGLMFINAGLNKFFNYMPVPEMTAEQMDVMGAFMKLSWLMPLVGAVEIIGGILFIPAKTRALGAIVIFPVMVGIVLHHAVLDPGNIAIALVLLLINLCISADNRKKYKPMVE
jgi:putative oxidoreductase